MRRESRLDARIVPDTARRVGPLERMARSSTFQATASPIMMLLLWEALVRVGVLDARFFPAPSAVLQELWVLLASGELLVHLGYTLSRVAVGFALGAIPAVLLGIAATISHTAVVWGIAFAGLYLWRGVDAETISEADFVVRINIASTKSYVSSILQRYRESLAKENAAA